MSAIPKPMTIGRLAKAAGVNVETVRYYQRRGLIREPHRPPGGQRHYGPAVLDQLHFIRQAQLLGFSLDEVKSLIRIADGGSCREARVIAEEKFRVLEARVVQLAEMRRRLKRFIELCRRNPRASFRPLMESLLAGAKREAG